MKQKVTITEFFKILEHAVKDFPLTFAESVQKEYQSPYFTLVSIVLSARSKDSITSTRMPELWKLANTPQKMIAAETVTLEKTLRPINFYINKATFLKKLSAIIINDFKGEIPKTIDELITLPGVGRKTANLTVSVVFGEPAICVDTHVHRIMNHIGYVKTKTPEQTEMALRAKLPKELWITANRILVSVGQNLANHTNINKPENILNKYQVI